MAGLLDQPPLSTYLDPMTFADTTNRISDTQWYKLAKALCYLQSLGGALATNNLRTGDTAYWIKVKILRALKGI